MVLSAFKVGAAAYGSNCAYARMAANQRMMGLAFGGSAGVSLGQAHAADTQFAIGNAMLDTNYKIASTMEDSLAAQEDKDRDFEKRTKSGFCTFG